MFILKKKTLKAVEILDLAIFEKEYIQTFNEQNSTNLKIISLHLKDI